MKMTRHMFLVATLVISAFAAVFYFACKKDKCNNVVCLNGGACNSGTCICPTGYEGVNCGDLSRYKFITTFNGGDTCGGGEGSDSSTHPAYSLLLLAVPTNNLQMLMVNLLDDPSDSAICTIINSDSFYFQGANNSITYYGGGKLSDDSLFLNYHVQQDTIPYNCEFLGLRQ